MPLAGCLYYVGRSAVCNTAIVEVPHKFDLQLAAMRQLYRGKAVQDCCGCFIHGSIGQSTFINTINNANGPPH